MSHGTTDRIIDLLDCREPADAESNARVCQILRGADGSQDVTRFQTGAGACRTTAQRNVLQCHEQGFTFYVGKGQIDAAGIPSDGIAVAYYMGALGHDAIDEATAYSSYVLVVVGHFGVGQFAGCADSYRQGGWDRTAV